MLVKFFKNLFGSNKIATSQEGTVKFFSFKKGFGFIVQKDTDKEIFVHSSNLIDKIRDNNKVTFDIEKSDKGPVATNVRVVKKHKA